MRAIFRKDLKRKAEDMSRSSSYRLRGRPVPNQKIERYKKEKGLIFEESLPDETTPSAISCETPRSLPESPPSEPEAPREGSPNYGSSVNTTGWSASALSSNDQEEDESSTHDITIPRPSSPLHPDVQCSAIKQESTKALMDLGSGTLSNDHRIVDEKDSMAKVDTVNGPQEFGECKCPLCILTLAGDAPADPDMEIFKPQLYQPRPKYQKSILIIVCL